MHLTFFSHKQKTDKKEGEYLPREFKEEKKMYIVGVTVFVKEEFREAFIQETLENAKKTRKEPLNLRFDVLQCQDDPNKFFLYEVYRNESGMSAHKETEHYKKWRENVAPMMAKPREGIKYSNLFPETAEAFQSDE